MNEDKIEVNFRESVYVLDLSKDDDDPCTQCELQCIEDTGHDNHKEFMDAVELALSSSCNEQMVWKKIRINQYKKRKLNL